MKTLGQRLNGLRWRFEATRRLWRGGAEPTMPFISPPLPEELLPAGLIDRPGPEAEVDSELLTVGGWAAFADGPCTRVELWLGDLALGRARLGVSRPDIAAIFDAPYAGVSGFELSVATAPLRVAGHSGVDLRGIATGPRDESLELEAVPIVLTDPVATKNRKPPPQPLSPSALSAGRGIRTLVVTHQLTLGGAQLYLMDLLNGLRSRGAIEPVVVSSVDGALREDLEELGVPVHITDLLSPGRLNSHLGRMEEFASWARPFNFDLVLINTATSAAVSGGEVASRLDIPAVWAIHESFEPALLWADLQPELLANAEAVIGKATFAVFEAEATQRIYELLIEPSRCRTLPYGLDLAKIDALRANFDRKEERQKAAIPPDVRLVVCIGTVEPRKAQVALAEAFDLVAASHPATHLAFVGGREDDLHTVALEECIEASPRGAQMTLIPVTPDVAAWYGMADLLVCASDVESLPRTVLEAMAWETPVLATGVFGLPELIDDGETGWLCEPRDIGSLAKALDRALSTSPESYDRIAREARGLVERRHSLAKYAEEMEQLLRDAVANHRQQR